MHPYPHYHKLMLITHRQDSPIESYLRFIKTCLTAGITSLQLREKNTSFGFQLEFGLRLRELCARYNVPLIANDSPQLAKALSADGLHLGQTDGSPEGAFRLLGRDALIGLSIETLPQLEQANTLPFLSYVTASAVFPTPTKTGEAQTFWGLAGVEELAKKSRHTLTAIGGIDLSNAEKIMMAGAKGLAVIGLIHNAENPTNIIHILRNITG